MQKRILLLLALVLAASMTMAACSSGGNSDNNTGGANTNSGEEMGGEEAAGGPAKWDIKTYDTFAFEPDAWTGQPGQEVEVTLDNSGQTLEHSWVVVQKDLTRDEAIAVQQTDDEAKKLIELTVPAGETTTQTVTLPDEPGEYFVVCHVPGHAAGGMVGTLTIEGGDMGSE